ncbi:unnamed protein product [Echinostoma caproni]|uniref:Wntless GOLD domain-containing protein n=1 Tax=Echinostoma caproni TaxID=27848 RepID=A0A3P8C4L4_9TREM|nr:unnamed protein product [Echinostoma caproni]
MAHSHEVRPLKCTLDPKAKRHEGHAHTIDDGFYYECEVLPLFTLASCHHEEYLLNLRIPANDKIGIIQDVWMVEIHQNGGFTKPCSRIKSATYDYGENNYGLGRWAVDS